MNLLQSFKSKSKIHFYLTLASGLSFGLTLQINWYIKNCFTGNFRNFLGGCSLFPLRLTLGSLFVALVFLSFWFGLRKVLTSQITSNYANNISFKITITLSLFILYAPSILFPYKEQKLYLAILVFFSTLTLLFSLKKELFYLLKRLLKKSEYFYLILGAVLIHFLIETIIAIYEQGNIFFVLQRFNRFIIFNILLILAIELFFSLITNKIFFSIALTCLISIFLVFTHIQKLKHLDLPLYTWDYQLSNEAIKIFPFIIQNILVLFSILLLFACFIFISIYSIKKEIFNINFKKRVFGVTSFFLFLIFWYIFTPDASSQRIRAFFDSQHRKTYRLKAGFYYFLFLSSKYLKYQYKPENYSEGNLTFLSKKYSTSFNNYSDNEDTINVVIYLIESFFDPENFGIKYKKDPIPFFRNLTEKHPSGTLITPVYGGLTANTEFEILTGLSVASNISVLPPGAATYSQLKKRNIPALPWVFRDKGYYTLAINAIGKKFFDRNKAYPVLGFENFISISEDTLNPKKIHGMYSDENIINVIIEKSRVNSPFFIFAASFLTHGGYDHAPLNPEFEVLMPPLSKRSGQNLQKFAHMANLADKELEKMINYFKNSQEKTIIILFGDHLPGLRYAFNELKIFEKKWPQNILNRYSTPIVFWSNFDLPHEKIFTSSNFVFDYLFKYMKIKSDFSQFNFASRMKNILPVSSNIFMDDNNNFLKFNDLSKKQLELADDYKFIQYDILKGKQFIMKD
jgi:phosphoglycerol transferase MdoB-like AlkP superfamily enzyme